MNLGGRDLGYYWKIVKMPVIVMVTINILGLLLGFIPFLGWVTAMIVGGLGLLIEIGLIIYIGYVVIKKYSGDIIHAFFAGAVAGMISGIVNVVLSIITFATIGTRITTIGGGIVYGTAIWIVGELIVSPLITGGLCVLAAFIVKSMGSTSSTGESFGSGY